MSDDRARLIKRLNELLNKVPKRAVNGDVATAQEFKKWHASASKRAKSSRVTDAELMALASEWERFDR
jgi:hypothetical protein